MSNNIEELKTSLNELYNEEIKSKEYYNEGLKELNDAMRDNEIKKKKKNQEKCLNQVKQALKDNNFKYYALLSYSNFATQLGIGLGASAASAAAGGAVIVYDPNALDKYVLYGSNEKKFEKKDISRLKDNGIRPWKKYMKAKKIRSFTIQKYNDLPQEMKKYVVI